MRRLVVAVAVGAAVLAGCSRQSQPTQNETGQDGTTPAPTAGTDAALSRYYDQKLAWTSCGQKVECANLTVPIDHANPRNGDMQIAVSRYRSGDGAKRQLVFDPGGPGGSGVEFAQSAPYFVTQQVLQKYDFVGFDPRGVGGSDPVDCLDDAETDKMLAADPVPDSPADIDAYAKENEKLAQSCARNSGKILGHIDSGSVVKDMDILRAALGQDKLDYLGKSYGTKLGAMYAQAYPQRVGRMVLDGVMAPDLTRAQVAEGQALAFEDTLRRFVEWCQQQSDCPVAGPDVDAGVAQVRQLFDDLAAEPVNGGDRPLTEGLAMQAVLFYLYFPYAGDWQKLSHGLGEAKAGRGAELLSMLDERLERDSQGRYKNNGNSYDALIAVTCSDGSGAKSVDDVRAMADSLEQKAPTFGAALGWAELSCLQWPVAHAADQSATTAAGAAPILLVSASHDPATPLKWAQRLNDELSDSRLIVLDGDGHTAYTTGSHCIDDAVDSYLVDGTLPEDGLTCSDRRTG